MATLSRRRWLVSAVLALALAGGAAAAEGPSHPAAVERMTVQTWPIRQFEIGSSQKKFGPLTFIGGLEMDSSNGDFGGFSSLRFLSPGQNFVGVADTGFWFFGRVTHDEDGRPSGISGFTMQHMVDDQGNVVGEKRLSDAESIAVRGDIATVGFERVHHISEYRLDPADMRGPLRDVDFLIPRNELRYNRSFEAIDYSPPDSPLKGARVLVTEHSLDDNGNLLAAILDGPQKGVFSVARKDGFDVSDCAFLPNGDLLLLERSFSIAAGVKLRLRLIRADSIGKGRLVDGPTLLTADMGYQIDNMEGLAVWRRTDGMLMLSLISDDNHSLLQRNLYLEFALDADAE